jgi:hypothetical protein
VIASSRASSIGWLGTLNGSRITITLDNAAAGTSTPLPEAVRVEQPRGLAEQHQALRAEPRREPPRRLGQHPV